MPEQTSGQGTTTLAAKAPKQRGSSDKTGQATRERIRAHLLERWGPYCYLCLLNGRSVEEARIDLTLKHPDPMSFTRDHIIPRARGGNNHVNNQRPAHNLCNQQRGATPLHHARRTK
jgi:5-methylcytosine-specific restriction endonuclease McrA